MRRLPPLNALRMFEAAARSLNFSVAAAELCVTHSAVSHQMRALEDWFGRPLFVRHASGVRLTEAGERLQQSAAQAFSQLEARCGELLQHGAGSELVLGAPASFLANWLIPRLTVFEAAAPGLHLRLQTRGDFSELASGRIDALILSGAPPWPREVLATALIEERIGPVCAPDWAQRPRQMSEVPGLPRLRTTSRPEAWADWAAAVGVAPDEVAAGRAFDHLALMLEAAASGLGLGIAPALLVERELAQQRLVAPLGFVASGRAFCLCVTAARAAELPLQALRTGLIACAGQA